MYADPKKIKKHFQKSIDKYGTNAVVQKTMAEELSSLLEGEVFPCILELGAGTGFLTEQLAKKINFNKYFANDLVEKSGVFVKKYVSTAEFQSGDFRKISFKKRFDLIAANAVFQWFEDLDKILLFCYKNLNNQGILAFSTFIPNNYKEIRDITGLTLKYKSVEELKKLLEKDFDIENIKQREQILKFDNPLKVLAHMKNTGVNSLSDIPWTIKEVKNFCTKYQEKYPNIELTYSYVLIIAKAKKN